MNREQLEEIRVLHASWRTSVASCTQQGSPCTECANWAAATAARVPALLDEIDRRDRERDRLWAMVGRVHAVASAAARGGVTLDPAEVIRVLEAAAGATTAEGSAEGGTSKGSSEVSS